MALTSTLRAAETTQYTYDALGRVVSAIDQSGRKVVYTYDSVGNRTRVSNGAEFQEIIPTAFTASSSSGTTGLSAAGGMRDGVFTGPASVHATQVETGAWIKADLGAVKNVNHVDLAPAIESSVGATPADLNDTGLEYSVDGTTWKAAASVTGVAPGASRTIALGGVALRYLRVRRLLSGRVSLGDLRLYSAAAPNTPLIAEPDSITSTGSAVTFDPRTNDRDLDGQAIAIASAGDPPHGTTVVNSGISITYTPDPGYAGGDGFSYTVSDGHNGIASARVSVMVQPGANHPPSAGADQFSVSDRATALVDGLNDLRVAANDYDPDGDVLTITGTTSPSHGALSVVGATLIQYQPTLGYTGSDSFSYTISDGRGGSSTATVTVTTANTNPIARADNERTATGVSVTFDPRLNDSDPNGDAITVSALATPAYGTATLNTNQTVTYTPNTGTSGIDTFRYTLTDARGATASGDISVVVAPNQAPFAVADSVTIGATGLTFDPRVNDSDPDGDALQVVSVGAASHGTAAAGGTSVTYTPTLPYAGPDSFTYTISDPAGATSTATISVTVTSPANTAPAAVSDTLSTFTNAAKVIDPRANDSDADSDPLAVTAVGAASHGTVTIASGGGSVTYSPAAGYVGSDSFGYTIGDGRGGFASSTVAVAVANSLWDPANKSSAVTLSNGNATASKTPSGSDGVVRAVRAGTGKFHFEIRVDAVGSSGRPAIGVVDSAANLDTYIGGNTHGVALYSSGSFIPGGSGFTLAAGDVVAIEVDVPGQVLYFQKSGGARFGPIAFNSGMSGAIYPAAGLYNTGDAATLNLGTSPWVIAPTAGFDGVNAAPVAVNDPIWVAKDSSDSFDPRANDTDLNGDVLTITAVGAAAHGTASIVGGTSITYTPASGYTGADSLSYTVSDGHGGTSTATINITVTLPVSVEYLIVGGGGGGGGGEGGGGGGGGEVKTGSAPVPGSGSYAVTVGSGGVGGTGVGMGSGTVGSTGGASSIATLVTGSAGGGGGGGTSATKGLDAPGGGGGGGRNQARGVSTGTGFQGGQRTGGGDAVGGGGGAGGAAPNATDGFAGAGGAGVSSSLGGTAVTYGGGGGGGNSFWSVPSGGAGTGGGGNGGTSAGGQASAGGRGGGGGGGGYNGGTSGGQVGGSGGSGIVIIRYPTGSLTATGGVVTTSGGYTIHTFTASGVFTP